MKRKIVGIFVMTLLIVSGVLPVMGSMNSNNTKSKSDLVNIQHETTLSPTKDGYMWVTGYTFDWEGHDSEVC